MNISKRIDSAEQSYRIGLRIPPDFRVITAVEVIIQPTLGVMELPRKAELEDGGAGD